MSRGHKRGSGERSNMYSENKLSNWAKYDPYDAEINALLKWTQTSVHFETALGDQINIVVRDAHPSFVCPVTVDDLISMLSRVPPEFLTGLSTIYLLGGTARQDKVAFGKLFRYGCYWYNKIALHAFPKRVLSERYSKLPAPDVMQEYERVGASWTRDREGWLFEFTPETLRAFYLYDVLLHEIGHHVDRPNLCSKSRTDSERYAKWFTTFCSQRIGLK